MTPDLPEPVTSVTVPETLSPSQLVLAADCPLRAILSVGQSQHPRLPPHPASERGSLFHALLERAGKGVIDRPDGERAAVERELERLLDAAEARLAGDPGTAHFARLDRTLPAIEWHNQTRDVLASAEDLLARAPPHDPQRVRGPALTYSELPHQGRFAEVRIDAPALRLAGRMDVVEKQPGGNVIVRDYKTGKIRDREGSVLSRIALQLRLYALAIESLDPNARVVLFAVESTEVPVEADPWILAETRSWLQHVLEQLPSGETKTTTELARPGPSCAHCSSRHVCPSYLNRAPELWVSGVEGSPMPYDVWGEILRFESHGEFSTLELMDKAGRKVRITRLSSRHGNTTDFLPGRSVFLFGLTTQQKNLTSGRYYHLRNFFEVPADVTQRRAWSLAVFAGKKLNHCE